MSGFIKRERSVNTVNPAGGVNPATTPNVSQYGWTKYEASIVNQLIQYVNSCKDFSDSAKEAAAYVQEQLALVDNYTAFIMDGLEDFEEKYVDSLTKYATLTDTYNNIVAMHEVIVKYLEDVTEYSKKAYDSAQDSKAWAHLSYITYLDDKGLLDKKGSYTIRSGGMFPSIPVTDSIWLVTTNAIEDVGLMGFIWNDGDRLTYTLREKKFNQIKKDFYNFQ